MGDLQGALAVKSGREAEKKIEKALKKNGFVKVDKVQIKELIETKEAKEKKYKNGKFFCCQHLYTNYRGKEGCKIDFAYVIMKDYFCFCSGVIESKCKDGDGSDHEKLEYIEKNYAKKCFESFDSFLLVVSGGYYDKKINTIHIPDKDENGNKIRIKITNKDLKKSFLRVFEMFEKDNDGFMVCNLTDFISNPETFL